MSEANIYIPNYHISSGWEGSKNNSFDTTDKYDYLLKIWEVSHRNYYGCSLPLMSDVLVGSNGELEVTNQINNSQDFLPSYYSVNINTLNKSFKKELNNSLPNLDIPIGYLNNLFDTTAKHLAELPFTKAVVEVNNSNIKFSLLFPNDRILMISKPIVNIEDIANNEIIFSYFINRELILSNAAETSTFVDGFKEFLSM